MHNNDDILLKQFFSNYREELADNGFTQRVMNQLPQSPNLLLSRLWSGLCAILTIVLFVAQDGIQIMAGLLREIFSNIQSTTADIDTRSLYIAAAVLLFMGYKKAMSLIQ